MLLSDALTVCENIPNSYIKYRIRGGWGKNKTQLSVSRVRGRVRVHHGNRMNFVELTRIKAQLLQSRGWFVFYEWGKDDSQVPIETCTEILDRNLME